MFSKFKIFKTSNTSINLYIQKKFWIQFFGLLIISTSIYWLKDSLLLVDLIINKNIPASFVLTSSITTLPVLNSILFPFVTVVCTLNVINSSSHNQEFIIMQSNGMSPKDLAKPFIRAGFIITFIAYILYLVVLPISYVALYKIRNVSSEKFITPSVITPDGFTYIDRNTTLYVSEITKDSILKNLVIFIKSGDTENVIISPEAKFRYDENTGFPYLILEETKFNSFDYDLFAETVLDFKQYVFPLITKVKNNGISVREVPTLYLIFSKYYLASLPNNPLAAMSYNYVMSSRYQELLIRFLSPLIPLSFILIAVNIMFSSPFRRTTSYIPFIKTAIISVLYLQILNFLFNNTDKYLYKVYSAPIFVILVLFLLFFMLYRKKELKLDKETKLERQIRVRFAIFKKRKFLPIYLKVKTVFNNLKEKIT